MLAFGYFVIYRSESGLALNNGGDIVQLYWPDDNLVNEVHQRRIQLQSAEGKTDYVKQEIDSVEKEAA